MKDTEMDGGITMVDGRPMRMVLDERGVFSRHEDPKIGIVASKKAKDEAEKPAAPTNKSTEGFKPPA